MRTCLLVVASLMCAACSATSSTDAASATTYTGPYSATIVESTVTTSLLGGGTIPCTNTYTLSGTLSVQLDKAGAATGSAHIIGTQVETAKSNGASCQLKGDLPTLWSPQLSGTASDIRFSDHYVATNGAYNVTNTTSFAGVLSGGVVTGSLSFTVAGSGTIGTSSIVQNGSSTINVTLH